MLPAIRDTKVDDFTRYLAILILIPDKQIYIRQDGKDVCDLIVPGSDINLK